MDKVVFSPEEKAGHFDEICSWYYRSNFGRLSKSDMDLLMFRFYLQKKIDTCKDEEGCIDYKKCSDMHIARELGITPARVRSLKTRVQFASPIACNWRVQFAALVPHAFFDADSKMVSVNVPDTGLFLEIQAYLEDRGCYVEKQINSSLLRLPVAFYIELLTEVEGGIPRDELTALIRSKFAGSREKAATFDSDKVSIGTYLSDGANLTTILANLGKILPSTAVLGKAFLTMLGAG